MFDGNFLLSTFGGGVTGLIYSALFMRHQKSSYCADKNRNIFLSIAFSFLRLGFLGVSMIVLVAYWHASLVFACGSFLTSFWLYTLAFAGNNA
jgi:hypothetical protein